MPGVVNFRWPLPKINTTVCKSADWDDTRELKIFFLGWESLLFIQKWSIRRCLKDGLDILLWWADPALRLSTHTATHSPPANGMGERIGKVRKLVGWDIYRLIRERKRKGKTRVVKAITHHVPQADRCPQVSKQWPPWKTTLTLAPVFYCWTWCYMVWNIIFVNSRQLSQL